MGIAVLGPLEVDGQSNGLGPRDRVVLSALVVRAGDPIRAEALAGALWGEDLPASWAKVVQGCVVRLRKRLGAAAIEHGTGGYRLTLTEVEVDARRFERLFEHAREALSRGDPERTIQLVREALELWRGQALADLEEWEPGRVEAARLTGARMDAEELRVESETRAGHARDVLEDARALVAQAPLRERRWALLATALHRAGRQAEALASLRQARAMLVDELGLEPGRELAELEQLVLRQDPSLDAVVELEFSTSCPYQGLLPYDSDDADSFFGREREVAECLRKLRDSGMLAVVGPSGVGKSSLIRAGVVAALLRSGAQVLTTSPGPRPTESLGELRERGRQTLVVDQAEEAIATCTDVGERERYFARLVKHVATGGVLVLSMRADHIGGLAPYPNMARLLEDGLYLLGPLSEPDLCSAIEGPARRAGLRLEPGLTDLLVREVEGEPRALPLLSHVLRETWERREGLTLTVDGYRATGGIRSAVANSAEQLYDAMDAPQRIRLRHLLLRLVVPTEDGDPVRARVPRGSLPADAEHQQLVEQLIDARLVSIDDDAVQIAHEALVRAWPRLRSWLDDDLDGQRLFRHLAGAANTWAAMGRPDSELYRGARLSRTEEWRDRAEPDLNDVEKAFVDASAGLARKEQRAAEFQIVHERRTSNWLRWALVGVGVLLVVTLVAGSLAILAASRAARERDRAELAANLADARRAGAQGPVHDNLATGLLLAVEGDRTDDSPQALENLGAALTRAGAVTAVRDVGELVGRPGTAWMPSLAASPNGDLVAGVVFSDGVRLFDATTLSPLPSAQVTPSSGSAAISPDGNRLAVTVNHRDEKPLRLYDLPRGTLSTNQPGGISSGSGIPYTDEDRPEVSFSRDGRRMVAELRQSGPATRWSPVGTTMVWDLSDLSEPVFSLRLRAVTQSALSPDGNRLYVATRGDQPVRVYDVGSGRRIASTRSPSVARAGATAVDVSPDGTTFVVTVGDRVLRYDTVTLQQRVPALTGHRGTLRDVTFSHGGRLLATSSDDRSVIVWDARTGEQLHRFVGGGPLGVDFSADDERLFTAGADGLLLAWNVARRQLILGEDSNTPTQNSSLALPSPDGHTVARAGSGRLWLENTLTGRRVAAPALTRDKSFTWSQDAQWLLSFGPDCVFTVWDASDGSVAARSQRFATDYNGLAAAFSADGRTVYVHDEQALHTLDRETMRPAHPSLPVGRHPAVVPHPRDGSVFLLDEGGTVLRVDPAAGELLSTTPDLLFNEDQDGVMSPDGSRLVVPGPGRRVRLLDVEKQTYVGRDSKTPWGSSPTYAPDGTQFALVQAERIRLWDGRTGEYQASVPLPSRTGTFSIAYRPDSSGLVIASTDGRTWTVDTRTSTWTARACATAGRNLSVEDWKQFFPGRPYRSTCPRWPAGA